MPRPFLSTSRPGIRVCVGAAQRCVHTGRAVRAAARAVQAEKEFTGTVVLKGPRFGPKFRKVRT